MTYHKFAASLAKGAKGEHALLKLWPDLEKLDGRRSDFKLKSTGETLELKTDSYDMRVTPNFFIERWSDEAKKKPGGPWQASSHSSKYWVYYFPCNNTLFIFDTEELSKALEPIIENLTPVSIPNKSWVTIGYRVPREMLMHLCIERRIYRAA